MKRTTAGGPAPGRWRRHWDALAGREQALVLLAAAVLGLAVAWWLFLAPAVATLRSSAQRHAELDARLGHMQSLQAEARRLLAAPRAQEPVDTLAALRTSIARQLPDSARLTVAGDRATLRFDAVPADALAQWLAQVRSNTRAAPIEARLQRNAGQANSWDGTLVLSLPAP